MTAVRDYEILSWAEVNLWEFTQYPIEEICVEVKDFLIRFNEFRKNRGYDLLNDILLPPINYKAPRFFKRWSFNEKLDKSSQEDISLINLEISLKLRIIQFEIYRMIWGV